MAPVRTLVPHRLRRSSEISRYSQCILVLEDLDRASMHDVYELFDALYVPVGDPFEDPTLQSLAAPRQVWDEPPEIVDARKRGPAECGAM